MPGLMEFMDSISKTSPQSMTDEQSKWIESYKRYDVPERITKGKTTFIEKDSSKEPSQTIIGS